MAVLISWLLSNALSIVGALALLVGGVWLGMWVEEPEVREETKVVEIPEVFDPEDLLEGTTPNVRREYQAPDTVHTTQECVTIPSWLTQSDTQKTRISGERRMEVFDEQNVPSTPAIQPSFQSGVAMLRGLNYLITPIRNGSPSLTVGSRRVVLQSLSPRDGSMMEFEYEVPRPSWAIDVRGDALAGRDMSAVSSTIGLAHRTPLGWLRLGAGYGVAVTDHIRQGWVGKVSLEKRLFTW